MLCGAWSWIQWSLWISFSLGYFMILLIFLFIFISTFILIFIFIWVYLYLVYRYVLLPRSDNYMQNSIENLSNLFLVLFYFIIIFSIEDKYSCLSLNCERYWGLTYSSLIILSIFYHQGSLLQATASISLDLTVMKQHYIENSHLVIETNGVHEVFYTFVASCCCSWWVTVSTWRTSNCGVAACVFRGLWLHAAQLLQGTHTHWHRAVGAIQPWQC